MKPSDRNLHRIVELARDTASRPGEPVPPDDIWLFSQRTAALWSRQRTRAERPAEQSDPLRLWERVGAWSLAASTAVVLLVAALTASTDLMAAAPAADPFGPWLQEEPQETLFF
jgi:anti-sigma-K factor RskA